MTRPVMKLRTKLVICTVAAVSGSLGVLAWSVNRFVRRQFDEVQRQQADTLVTQSQREFLRRGDEVSWALQEIAEAEATLRMALDLSRPQSDPSLYARDARAIATSRQLDFLEFVRDDGTLISSAQWPGRIGFKNDWVTQRRIGIARKRFSPKSSCRIRSIWGCWPFGSWVLGKRSCTSSEAGGWITRIPTGTDGA